MVELCVGWWCHASPADLRHGRQTGRPILVQRGHRGFVATISVLRFVGTTRVALPGKDSVGLSVGLVVAGCGRVLVSVGSCSL